MPFADPHHNDTAARTHTHTHTHRHTHRHTQTHTDTHRHTLDAAGTQESGGSERDWIATIKSIIGNEYFQVCLSTRCSFPSFHCSCNAVLLTCLMCVALHMHRLPPVQVAFVRLLAIRLVVFAKQAHQHLISHVQQGTVATVWAAWNWNLASACVRACVCVCLCVADVC